MQFGWYSNYKAITHASIQSIFFSFARLVEWGVIEVKRPSQHRLRLTCANAKKNRRIPCIFSDLACSMDAINATWSEGNSSADLRRQVGTLERSVLPIHLTIKIISFGTDKICSQVQNQTEEKIDDDFFPLVWIIGAFTPSWCWLLREGKEHVDSKPKGFTIRFVPLFPFLKQMVTNIFRPRPHP